MLASSRLDAVAPASLIQRVLERGAATPSPSCIASAAMSRSSPSSAVVLRGSGRAAGLLTRDGEPSLGPPRTTAGRPTRPLPQWAAHARRRGRCAAARRSVARCQIAGFDLPHRPIHEQVREIAESTAPPPATGVRLRGDDAAPRYKRTAGSSPMPQFQVPRLALFAALALVIVGCWPGGSSRARSRRTAKSASSRSLPMRARPTPAPRRQRTPASSASSCSMPQSSLTDAEKIHDDNQELLVLQQDVSDALARAQRRLRGAGTRRPSPISRSR